MKVKIGNKKYWAKKSKTCPFVYVYRDFFAYLIDDICIGLSMTYLVNNFAEEGGENNAEKG